MSLHEWMLHSRANNGSFYYYLVGRSDYDTLAEQVPSLRNMPASWLMLNQTPPEGPFKPEPAPLDLAELINVRSAPSLAGEGPDGKQVPANLSQMPESNGTDCIACMVRN